MSGKRLELLKEIAPPVTRVAVIRDPAVPAGSGGLAAIQTVAPSVGVELTPIGVRNDEIERGITAFARSANGGLIVVGPTSSVQLYRDLIIALAARYRLPAVYASTVWSKAGGLISYGVDGSTRSWSVPIRCSPRAACNSLRWRRITGCPRSISIACLPISAG